MMHELGITESILKVALKHAAKASASRILSISLNIGSLSDLEDDWIRKYFDYLSKETIAAGARLLIQRIPVKFLCNDCNFEFCADLENTEEVKCPECNSINLVLLSGKEYKITSMEVL